MAVVDSPGEIQIRESSRVDGAVTLAVDGELDLFTAVALRATLDPILAHPPRRLVFDLAGLTFIDSSGVAVLLAAANQVQIVEIANPSTAIRRVIELSGLTTILRIPT